MEQTFNPLTWVVAMFFAHSLGMFGAFYVYDDAKKRHLNRLWPIGWAVCTYLAVIIIPLFYLVSRPPILFDNVPKLSIKKKTMIYFIPLAIFLVIALIITLVVIIEGVMEIW